MNHLTKSLSILALSMAVGSAEAAVANASAAFDWSTFSVIGYAMGPGPAPTISWNNQYSSVSAYTDQTSNNNYSPDWVSSISSSASSGSTSASSATANASQLLSVASDTDVSVNSYSTAYSYRGGSFTVSGNGILVFSANYSLSANLTPGDLTNNNYANAGVYFWINNYSQNSNGYFSANQNIYLDGYDDPEVLTKDDTLFLALVVKDGENFSFETESYASANVASVVPVPSAVWLFVSAIAGFLGVSRRQQKAV